MKDFEAIYPVSPLQQGFIFHSLLEPESGAYVVQLCCKLEGSLSSVDFEKAWQRLVERHAVFRTAFLGEKAKEFMQTVRRQVKVPFDYEDLRHLPSEQQQEMVNSLLSEERKRGFVLSQAPLMRLHLYRVEEDSHFFVWSCHHLLLDGWSLTLVMQELMQLLEGYSWGEERVLPKIRPYSDYIEWVKNRNMQQAELFWRDKLKGFAAPTKLMNMRSDGLDGLEGKRYKEQMQSLSVELSEQLQLFARQNGLTVSTLIQGAWAQLLRCYSGEEDVVFGATLSGRPADLLGVESMIGMFINTLPVRVQVPKEATVLSWLKQLQRDSAELRQYEYCPLVEIQGWSEISRGEKLFDSIVVFENYPGSGAKAEQSPIRIRDIHSFEQTNYPITLVAAPGQKLAIKMQYDSQLFDEAAISRMMGHFCQLLKGFVAAPEEPLSSLSLLTEAERLQLLVEWKETVSEYPREQTVDRLFEEQAARTPDAIAVVIGKQSLCYSELNSRANQLARYLRAQGVGEGTLVGLCMERSLEMVVGMLGILKVGAAYVPLDPAYPKERLVFMLEDSQVPVLVTQAKLAERLPQQAASLLLLDQDWERIALENTENLVSDLTADSLAYVIYTSGSTGQPKGVCIPHRGIVRLVKNTAYVDFSPEQVFLQASTISFDAATFEIWGSLLNGARLALLPPHQPSLEELGAAIEQYGVTTLFLTVALFNLMVEHQLDSLGGVKQLLFGGEKVSVQHVRQALKKDGVRWISVYGPTESTTFTTYYPLKLQDADRTSIPIGRPIANTEVYVLDARLQPVPVGVPGELYIGGDGLALGYLNRPELTAERFVANPFAKEAGARLYKTGDLVRYLPDGNIDFIGRIDNQVKIRGFRIELGEIETVLMEHPAVRQTVVVAREDVPGDKRLVAYVVSHEQGELTSAWRDYLKGKLPEYMVPSLFVTLDSLPLTANGKIDKRALPAPDPALLISEQEFVAPRDQMEELVANIWSQLLRLPQIGVYDNFFALGGHSLLATQAVSRLREAFSVNLPLPVLFERPTVAELAAYLKNHRAGEDLQNAPIIPVEREGEGLVLSYAQQRLWFLDHLLPDRAAYNIPVFLRLQGTLRVDALEQSLNAIIERHEILRTTFVDVDGQPLQVVAPKQELRLNVLDLQSLALREKEAELSRLAQEDANGSFDLKKGPLLRASLVQLAEQEFVLLLNMHHMISDGWSINVFLQELSQLYNAFARGEEAALAKLPVQFADYAHWQREWMGQKVLAEQLAYWKQQLSGSEPLLELPTDRPRPAVQTFAGGHVGVTFSKELVDGLHKFSRTQGATLFMTLLAAYQLLLHRYSEQEDILVGSPIAGRNRPEMEGLIGFFVNTLVFRTKLSKNMSFRELLTRVREVALQAYAHQDVPLDRIVDEVRPERSLRYSPLFQVSFAMQNASLDEFVLDGLKVRSYDDFEYVTAKYDLTLYITEAENEMQASFEYNTDLFDRETIERMAGHFTTLLQSILQNPKQTIDQLALLSATESERLHEWSGANTEDLLTASIPAAFETQVEKTPDAIALEMDGVTLTYREVNSRANQLADRLQKLGVVRESLVAICANRSPELVAGLLGILKAGGAYLPIDPEYPEDRIRYMLADSGAKFLLTTKQLASQLPIGSGCFATLCLEDVPFDSTAVEKGSAASQATDLAYVIYTSGSTGKPKGTELQQGSVVNLAHWKRDLFGYSEKDTILQFASFSFDASVWETFPALLNGAKLYLLSGEQRQSVAAFAEAVEKTKATTVTLPTVFFQQIALHVTPEDRVKFATMKRIFVAGEALQAHVVRQWQKHFGTSIEIINAYGPTESTVCATIYPIDQLLSEEQTTLPIGRPIANRSVYVLDGQMQRVPIGVPGELYIGGSGLARGYRNRAELTAERFVKNPFSNQSGDRLYKTGDLVRFLPNGQLEFLKRIDEQVKIRGFRIELGEIESVLASHPSVQAAVVSVLEDANSGDKRLVGYVVVDSAEQDAVASLDSLELRNFLKEQLPSYMVPAFFVQLDEIPLTQNGKVDRKSLPAPDFNLGGSTKLNQSPRTANEQKLAEIWQQVLRVPQVGLFDNFFERGGDSILSIQIVSRANQAGLRLTPKMMFEHQTIAELATALLQKDVQEQVEAEQGTVTGDVPLLPIQQWFFEQNFANQQHWNQSMLLTVDQAVDPALLKQAVGALLAHHDALRLRFVKENGEWKQFNHGLEKEVPFEVVDLAAVSASEKISQIEAYAEEVQKSFRLSAGPLLRAVYFSLGASTPGRLLIVVHHLAVDGVSWRILLEDLQKAYEQLSRGEQVQLPPKTTSYKQWAEQLVDSATQGSVQQELAFWLSQGEKIEAKLPIDDPSGANTGATTEEITTSLTVEETRALLQEVPAAYRTQINDVLLTALVMATRPWTGLPSLLLHLEGHGREEIAPGLDLSRTVGWFTSMYPVRLDLEGTETSADALKTIKEQLRRVPNKGIGYGILRYLSVAKKALQELPPAQISFNYLGQFDSLGEGSDSSLFGLATESRGAHSDPNALRSHLLDVTGAITGGQLHITWLYSRELHHKSTMEHLAERFMAQLRELIVHCTSSEAFGYTPSDFPLAKLNQHQLDLSVGSDRLIESIYPLSPLQQGLLYHSLYQEKSGDYVVQLAVAFEGDFHPAKFEQAWQQAVNRHAILRTSFVWEGLEEPHQIVKSQVHMAWEHHDWRHFSSAEQEERLQAFLQEDRAKGFDFSKPPMRFCLLRLTDDAYQFVWSHHHVLLDGWSLPLLLEDVFAFYSSLCNGQTLEKEPSLPYARYLEWLQSQDLQEAEQFWRDALKGFTAPTPIGSLAHRQLLDSETASKDYRQQEFELSLQQTKTLQEWARQHQLTLSTIVQGAWALLLSRYSGEEDVVFGMTGSGRPADLPGVESMVGLFINTLPTRVQVQPEEPIVDWLKRLQAKQAEIRQYEYTPLVNVQSWSEVPQGMPLFESLYVFENYPVAEEANELLQNVRIRHAKGMEQTNYPISLVAAAPKDNVWLKLMYDQMRIDDFTARKMLEQLDLLLEGMTVQENRRLLDVSMLTQTEREQLLVSWNDTAADVLPGTGVHEWIGHQALAAPDALAVVMGEKSLTYGELNSRANQLASYLKERGVGKESLVGLLMERSPELLVGMLAILKAGGAYVPIDTAYPAERIAYVVADSQVSLLLTRSHLVSDLKALGVETICLDTDWQRIEQQSDAEVQTDVAADNLAYVIYTSGSTGTPKGVQIEHKALMNMVSWHIRAYGLKPQDRSTQLAGTAFDASVWEVWPYLVAGASLHLPDEDTRLNPEQLRDYLLDRNITMSYLPTPLAESLLQLEWPQEASLRYLYTGGDILHQAPTKELPFVLVNHYGPTENTVVATAYVVEPAEDGAKQALTPAIGRPIANVEVYVLDAHRQPVPVGVPGELYIGGFGLARGYLGRPELTEERFVPHPFAKEPQARLYKTGDVVRYRADGNLEFIGRSDDQVKIRGFRVELGEIEAVLGHHPAVLQAVVLTYEEEPNDKRLVAYLVATREEDLVSELRDFLKGKLPSYMIPSFYVTLDKFPLTANGKIDKKALPAPDTKDLLPDAEFVAPRNAAEELVAYIWGQVLHRNQVGATDNFFELGGHSLLATQAISRLREAFSCELTVRVLFENPTVAEMAAYLERLQRGATNQPGRIVPLEREGLALPLSFAQQRLWFLDRLLPNRALYNIPAFLRIQGNVDVDVFLQSFRRAAQRHESLRTTFLEVEGQPVQVIALELELTIPVIDLRMLEKSARETELLRLAQEEANRPFDLRVGPLLRSAWVQLAEQEAVWLLNMHHIVSDGWSMDVLLRDTAALYNAKTQGKTAALPDLPIQYADYARWQQQWLQGDVLDEQLSYWKQQLAGSAPLLELPTDRPRPSAQTYAGALHRLTIRPELFEKIQELSRKEGTTLFMTLLAAFQTLLFRYSGQEDVLVGSPIANRNREETEGLIGFFVNTLVFRTALSGDLRFHELLARVREVALGAYAHQDLPFEKIVEELGIERTLSTSPLFQVMFTLQTATKETELFEGLTLRPLEDTEWTLSKFDLTLHLVETGASLQAILEYNTDLFDQGTIARMAGQFVTLLESVVGNPRQQLASLSLLSEKEKRQLAKWQGQKAEALPQSSIHRLFEEQAETAPDAVALVMGESQLTYGELNERANQLAHYLQAQGVQAESLVGLCVERCFDMIVALLGILKAGGAYVPFDPSYPEERLAYMLEDSNVSLVVTQDKFSAKLAKQSVRTICLDTEWEQIATESHRNLDESVTLDNLAYVMYTSGSTGQPKGVCISHRGVVRLVKNTEYVDFSPEQVFLQASTISFDAATFEIWGSLLNGARLALLPPHQPTLEKLGSAIEQYGVTTLFLTVALFNLMVEHQLESLGGVKHLLFGGEKVSVQHVSQALKKDGVRWMSVYGPTESTTFTTYYPLTTQDSHRTSIPIGRPIANTEVYVLDARLQPVPVGVPGELYIGGDGLALGYLNRPELTAERFVANPFAKDAGSRLYKTGDLVRYLPDGNIDFIGRIDNQVKIRGFRIELGEIETALMEHPAVRQTVVVAREDVPGDNRLVAYVVSQEQGELAGVWREYLKGKLPEYMVPSLFVTLDSLPLTANGKIDKRALPAPDPSLLIAEQESVAPRDPMEELVGNIWAQVLHLNQVGVHDNFFDLGGHSLLATQVASRLREAFGLEVPLRVLFEHPTVGELVAAIKQLQSHGEIQPEPILPALREGIDLPLSYAQQRLWFLDRLIPNRAVYNIPNFFRLQGELHLEALKNSLQAMVDRHESFRTAFADVEGQAIQVIQQQLELPFPILDLQHLPAEKREQELLRLAQEEANRPFDLEKGPLLRASLVRLDAQESVFMFTMHHIISDGWSMGIFLRELFAFYNAFSRQELPTLPNLPVQYADFAVWQRQWLQGEVLDQQLAYWKRQLSGCEPLLQLPTDHPRPAVQTYTGAHYALTIPQALYEKLQTLNRTEGSTLFMTLLAAYQILLYRYTGQEDILVGSPIAGRNRQEIEGLIGFYVNTLVFKGQLAGEIRFTEFLAQVREAALMAYAHQELPFEKIVDELGLERSLSYSPLFQVMFALQNAPMEVPPLEGLTVLPYEPGDLVIAKFDLTLNVGEKDNGLQAIFEYNTDLFAEETIVRMAEQYVTLLEGIVENPQEQVSRLPMITERERQQLLVTWNDTKTAYPREKCVHQLFEEQVLATPDSIAVVIGEESLTYAELNVRANRLAHFLRAQGVQTESLVGLCVERSLEMIVGMLGIVKAGGAYVPLDPEYPIERLTYMIEDTQVSLLLTQEHLTKRLPQDLARTVCLDVEWPLIEQSSSDNLEIYVTGENLVNVIYTSGSTGLPKGVLVPHRGIVRLVKNTNYLSFANDQVFLQASTISFDAAVFEIWGSLLNGAKLVLLPPHLPSVLEIGDTIKKYGVTTMWLTSGLFNLIVDNALESLSGVKSILVGGDVVSVPHAREVLKLGSIQLINGYGPTENTTFTCCHPITLEDCQRTTLPIGRPIANTEVYILDEHMQPVPIGVPGELYAAGDGLARGYLNRPELTEKRFVKNPFSDDPAAKIYETGDLVRRLPDGTIEFIGRRDNQVKIRGFRIELGEIKGVLSEHPAVLESTVIVHQGAKGEKRLVAYFVIDPAAKCETLDLRNFMKEKLPDYMVPAFFVELSQMPLTPNGKVDLKALPAPHAILLDGEKEYAAPRTDAERQLAHIWQQLLRLERVGIHDNFFELGGDSILSIQIVARAHQEGLHLTPKQMFEHQTIAELAAAIAETADAAPIIADQGLVTGELPLLPIQQWFFEQNFAEQAHWNQSMMLTVRQQLDPSLLKQAIHALLAHHDALRLRFVQEVGQWKQVNALPDETVPLDVVDLTATPKSEQRSKIEAWAEQAQRSLDLTNGPLLRVVYFDLGAEQEGRLLIVVHHVSVDGVSWRILLEHLQTVYEQLQKGETVRLPQKTTSYKQWSERLAEYAQIDAIRQELDYWLEQEEKDFASLPLDHMGGRNLQSTAEQLAVSLTEEETRLLLQTVPSAYRTQINDVLLTALVQAASDWVGKRSLRLNLEGHGRESILEGVDLSRTVGWFTTMYPVLLDLEGIDSLADALKAVKEQLRRIPNKGIGYGLLRYLSGCGDVLQNRQHPEISFNYLGQFDQVVSSNDALFGMAEESGGSHSSPLAARSHLLDITGAITGGQLHMAFLYSRELHDRETIQGLAERFLAELRALIAHCCSPEAFGYTPSDFPLAEVNQQQIDRMTREIGLIENIYPMTPLQQGMMFHTLYAQDGGEYVVQLSFTMQGEVRLFEFEQAWQQAASRHAILRTSFAWEGLMEPHQIVHEQANLTFVHDDWQALAKEEQEERLQTLLQVDRTQSFDFTKPPMRFYLIRLSQQAYRFVWSHHHVLLDGWSMPLVFSDVFAIYHQLCKGQALALQTPVPYARYMEWLKAQDLQKAEQFWRQTLQGFVAPTSIGDGSLRLSVRSDEPGERYGRQTLALSEDQTQLLQAFARQNQLTLNTLVQGAFALLQSRYSGEDDIVYGQTGSGRPADLPGVETMVGLFINTLPVRLHVEEDAIVSDWLKGLQAKQAEIRQYEYSPLVQVQSWSEVPQGVPLFETLYVFENYPVAEGMADVVDELQIGDASGVEQTNYPLTLVAASPESMLSLKLMYDRDQFEDATIQRMLGHLTTLLTEMATKTAQRLGDVSLVTEAEREQLLVTWNETKTDYPREKCVHQVFEEQALQSPDAVAVVFGEASLTYAELNGRANQLAHYLRARGVGEGDLVGLCMERSLAMIVGLLGILKAGGAYVPLDPAYPKERLTYMLEDSGVALLLTQAHLISEIPQQLVKLVCLDEDFAEIVQESTDPVSTSAKADSLAYVIYTSGSTGKPKGVCIPHRGIVRLVKNAGYAEFSPEHVFLQLATISFDAATLEIWGSLLNGARLAIMPSHQPTLEELADALMHYGVTTLFLTTGLFHLMVDHQVQALAGLKQLMFGGDVGSVAHARKVMQLGSVQLFNLYGPSESTTAATCCQITEADLEHHSLPIGRPIANTEVYVLDRNGQPVPIGILGELYIGGDGLALGYLHREALTAERFLPNPFSQEPGSLLYKTGDVVRYLPGGTLEFIGRSDDQVKIRGFRIELGEIEAVLALHLAVRKSVVQVQERVPGEKHLIAYLVLDETPDADSAMQAAEWRRYLQNRLPGYMVPSAFVTLDEMPLTLNGKIDYKALPKVELSEWMERVAYVAPRNPLEEVLVGIFQEVLGIDSLGIDDHFFAIGGHSLLATQVISRLRETLQVVVPLRALFESPTVAEFAVVVAEAQKQEPLSAEELIPKSVHSPEELLPDEVDDLSDEEIAMMLEGLLGNEGDLE